jgi:hypothetical protein
MRHSFAAQKDDGVRLRAPVEIDAREPKRRGFDLSKAGRPDCSSS